MLNGPALPFISVMSTPAVVIASTIATCPAHPAPVQAIAPTCGVLPVANPDDRAEDNQFAALPQLEGIERLDATYQVHWPATYEFPAYVSATTFGLAASACLALSASSSAMRCLSLASRASFVSWIRLAASSLICSCRCSSARNACAFILGSSVGRAGVARKLSSCLNCTKLTGGLAWPVWPCARGVKPATKSTGTNRILRKLANRSIRLVISVYNMMASGMLPLPTTQ